MALMSTTTEIVSGDLTTSLTFFLSSELIEAFRNVISTSELIVAALMLAIVARAGAGWLEDNRGGGTAGVMLSQTRDELRRFLSVVGFLASTCVVQIGVVLVRSTVQQPAARILTIVSTLALLRIVLSSVRLQRTTLKAD